MFRRITLATFLLLAVQPFALALGVRRAIFAPAVDEETCRAPRPQRDFSARQERAYLWLETTSQRSADRLRVEWVDPAGQVASTVPFPPQSAHAASCFITALPIAGYAPSYQPGIWSARIYANNRLATTLPLRITTDRNSVEPRGGLAVTGLSRSQAPAGDVELTLHGSGFMPDATVQIAPVGYPSFIVASVQPERVTEHQLTVRTTLRDPAEYQLTVLAPDGRASQPSRFIVGFRGYKLPIPAGEAWELTQANHGGYSHDGRTWYAYDIAPRGHRCVVAMKAGIAYTYDMGLGHTESRSFGNYITIDHGNGEYSHYAHLASGTFVVANGQRVEQGQALALAGNSGFSFGMHLHVQVTRTFNISSQSVPFLFEDVMSQSPDGPPPGLPSSRARGLVQSANVSSLCDCQARSKNQVWAANGLQQSQWWHSPLTVPQRTSRLQVTLRWRGDADLDLHLVSPSGHHYGWYGDTHGYSGVEGNPERFELPTPEPGTWRVSVNARAAPRGPEPFQVESTSWF